MRHCISTVIIHCGASVFARHSCSSLHAFFISKWRSRAWHECDRGWHRGTPLLRVLFRKCWANLGAERQASKHTPPFVQIKWSLKLINYALCMFACVESTVGLIWVEPMLMNCLYLDLLMNPYSCSLDIVGV